MKGSHRNRFLEHPAYQSRTNVEWIGFPVVDDAPSHRLLSGFAGLAALVLPVGLMAAPTSETLAVVGPPGRDAAAIVAGAGGTILRMGGWSNVLVVQAGSPGLVARLYASGAWLVIDARFAAGCDPTPRFPIP